MCSPLHGAGERGEGLRGEGAAAADGGAASLVEFAGDGPDASGAGGDMDVGMAPLHHLFKPGYELTDEDRAALVEHPGKGREMPGLYAVGGEDGCALAS